MPNVVYERIYNAMLFFVHVKLVFLLLSSHLHKEFKKMSPTLFRPVITANDYVMSILSTFLSYFVLNIGKKMCKK